MTNDDILHTDARAMVGDGVGGLDSELVEPTWFISHEQGYKTFDVYEVTRDARKFVHQYDMPRDAIWLANRQNCLLYMQDLERKKRFVVYAPKDWLQDYTAARDAQRKAVADARALLVKGKV